MQPPADKIATGQMLRNTFRSAFRASYIGGLNNSNNSLGKSKMPFNKLIDEEEVDENTFRVKPNFQRPNDSFKVYAKKGKVYLESTGFLCFGGSRLYDAELHNTKLTIKSGESIARFVDFNAVSSKVEVNGKKVYICFDQMKQQGCIKFTPEGHGEQESNKWGQILSKICAESNGVAKKYTYLASKVPRFYFSKHVLSSEFQAHANTGDIMLYRSEHGAALAQRVVTNSQYDHVGLVLRNRKNQLMIYDSSSTDGVGLTPWKQVIKYDLYEDIEKIAWRPLYMKLTDRDVEIVEQFVAKTLGKQFEISMQKLLQFKSKLQRTKEEEEKKTYFCSELVARLYKQLGILDEEKSSSAYYPIDLSDKGALNLKRQGVSLGPQHIIAFEKS